MKKLLVASTIALSMSFATSSHALDPVTAGAAAAGAEAAGAAAGAAVGGAAGAAVGAVTTAGIAAGVVVGAAGAGYVTSELMNKYAFKGEASCSGCEPAQTATQIGAALGTGGVIGALAVAGADVAGLAAIGGAVGGGAIVGAGVLVAAPIVAAAVLGGAVYWYFKDAMPSPNNASSSANSAP